MSEGFFTDEFVLMGKAENFINDYAENDGKVVEEIENLPEEPSPYERNYRVTFEDETVSDWHILFDGYYTGSPVYEWEVASADKFNEVIK